MPANTGQTDALNTGRFHIIRNGWQPYLKCKRELSLEPPSVWGPGLQPMLPIRTTRRNNEEETHLKLCVDNMHTIYDFTHWSVDLISSLHLSICSVIFFIPSIFCKIFLSIWKWQLCFVPLSPQSSPAAPWSECRHSCSYRWEHDTCPTFVRSHWRSCPSLSMCCSIDVSNRESPRVNSTIVWLQTLSPRRFICPCNAFLSSSLNPVSTRMISSTACGPGGHRDTLSKISCFSNSGLSSAV